MRVRGCAVLLAFLAIVAPNEAVVLKAKASLGHPSILDQGTEDISDELVNRLACIAALKEEFEEELEEFDELIATHACVVEENNTDKAKEVAQMRWFYERKLSMKDNSNHFKNKSFEDLKEDEVLKLKFWLQFLAQYVYCDYGVEYGIAMEVLTKPNQDLKETERILKEMKEANKAEYLESGPEEAQESDESEEAEESEQVTKQPQNGNTSVEPGFRPEEELSEENGQLKEEQKLFEANKEVQAEACMEAYTELPDLTQDFDVGNMTNNTQLGSGRQGTVYEATSNQVVRGEINPSTTYAVKSFRCPNKAQDEIDINLTFKNHNVRKIVKSHGIVEMKNEQGKVIKKQMVMDLLIKSDWDNQSCQFTSEETKKKALEGAVSFFFSSLLAGWVSSDTRPGHNMWCKKDGEVVFFDFGMSTKVDWDYSRDFFKKLPDNFRSIVVTPFGATGADILEVLPQDIREELEEKLDREETFDMSVHELVEKLFEEEEESLE